MRIVPLLVTLPALVLANGCVSNNRAPFTGLIYSNVKAPESAGVGVVKKKGQACAVNILGLVAVGDASIEAAKKQGGIQQVATVDGESMNILGFFQKYCSLVGGQ
jgi:hypothetical protein